MTDHPGWTDEQVEQIVGRLLQVGVILSAMVVIAGGVLYLIRHGHESTDFSNFQGEPPELRTLGGIWGDAVSGRARGLVQLGLVLLILTPVARVALTVFAFLRQHDAIYVFVTLVVLGVLLFSLLRGYTGLQ